MIKFLSILILAAAATCATQAFDNQQSANCGLPGRVDIWPLPTPNAETCVACKFKSRATLLKIREGDFYFSCELVTYSVIKVLEGEFPHKELSFLLVEHWPVPEQGDNAGNPLPPCFTDDSKAFFWLNRDDNSKSDFHNIQTYLVKSKNSTLKPAGFEAWAKKIKAARQSAGSGTDSPSTS